MSAGAAEETGGGRVLRHPERGRYQRSFIDQVLDEALIGHVGIVVDGAPVVIPMSIARDGDQLYLHGSPLSRLLGTAAAAPQVCVTVTLLDGLVLARSVFGHSMNYRSVVVTGQARELTDLTHRERALRCIVEHLAPGRWDEARQPTPKELRATVVLAVAIDGASAKVRSGPPVDPRSDRRRDTWAGVLPLRLCAAAPVQDGGSVAPPTLIAAWPRQEPA